MEQELSKGQILHAASDLFFEKGYREVSMRDIARQLGCSHGAIYYHFKNKVDLFNELLQAGFELLNTTMSEIVEKEHKLEDLLISFLEFGFKYPNHYEIMFITRVDAFLEHPAPVESYQRFLNEVSKFNISPSDTYSIFVSLHGFISYHLRSKPFFDRGKELAKQHVEFLTKRVQQ